MRSGAHALVAIALALASQSAIGCRKDQPSPAQGKNASEYRTVFHATGTIVSVDERAHDEQSEDLLPGPRVCYTIDSFAEIPESERAAFASAERQRFEKQGPRCHDTAIDPSAVHLKAGDGVDIDFVLKAAGQISVVKISTHGVDL